MWNINLEGIPANLGWGFLKKYYCEGERRRFFWWYFPFFVNLWSICPKGAYLTILKLIFMRRSSHYARDGGDIPVPKVKKVFAIYDAPNAEWMVEMIKKCLRFYLWRNNYLVQSVGQHSWKWVLAASIRPINRPYSESNLKANRYFSPLMTSFDILQGAIQLGVVASGVEDFPI